LVDENIRAEWKRGIEKEWVIRKRKFGVRKEEKDG
jgi:hypothetical protein